MDPVKLITIVLIANLSMYHAGNVKSPSTPLHVLPGPLSRHLVLPCIGLKGGRYLHTRIAYYANSSATFQSQLLVSGDVNPNPGPTNYGNYYSSNSGSLLNGEIKRIVYDRSFLLRCNPIWKTGKKGSITERTWKNITALGICPSRPFYQKRTKRGGRRKQRKIQILITPCVNKRIPMPGQTGPNMNNLRHITVPPDRSLEVRNYSEIEVVRRVRDQHPSELRKMPNHANLVSVNITKSYHGQNSHHRRMNLPSVLLCNARSLNNKLDEMEIILRERKIDVAAVTETWFRSDMPTHLVAMTDYNLFTKSRLLRQGGGVALYVRDAFNPVEMKVEVPTQLEVLWVRMRPDRLPREISHVVVAVVYHPPDSLLTDMLIDHLQDTMDQIMGQHPDVGIAIMGDFNQLDLTTLLANTNFKQVVDSPTRENRILDKIVTNFSDLYHRPLICCPLGASDHNTVIWSPVAPTRLKNSTLKRTTRPLRDSDMRRFGSWITKYDWSSVITEASSDEQTESFYTILNSQIDNFLPTKTIRMHCRDKKWITPHIKSLIKDRQAAFNDNNREMARKLANCVKREIRKAKHEYYNDRVRKHKKANPAEWYKEIKIMTNMKNSNTFITVPGVDKDDIPAIANRINDFFRSVSQDVPALNVGNLPAYLPDPSPPPSIQPWHVFQQLKKVKIGKAVGPDMMPSRIIREFSCELSTPLAHIFNTSLAEGAVPKLWKRAVVVPVPKTSPATIDKLRPISLTDTFAKVFEGFVSRWLMQAIEKELDSKQFGNIKGLSTTHCLVDMLHYLFHHAEKGKAVSTLVMTDFRKAFDRINHTIAIQKMISLGIKPTLIRWIADFLAERTQCVRYRGVKSEWVTLNAGVPQGTKLGPIVFLIVINNALHDSDNAYWKYVDDVTVVDTRFAGDQPDVLERTLHNFAEWSTSNGMSLNPAKCESMQVCFMKKPPEPALLAIHGQPLKQSVSVKLLGVHIRSDLKWNDHVDFMIKRANGRIHIIRILKGHGLPTEDLCTIYMGFLRPLLEYASPVWNGGLTKQQVSRLERVQKRSLKIILGPNFQSYDSALNVLDLPSLADRRKALCLTFAERLISNERVSYLIPPPKNTRTLRKSNTREQLKCRTNRFRNSPIPYLIDLLNSQS